MANRVVWFDIPVEDLGRAIEFYSKVLNVSVEEAHGVAVLEHSGNDVAGCLFKSDDEEPSNRGLLLYFNVSGRLVCFAQDPSLFECSEECAHPLLLYLRENLERFRRILEGVHDPGRDGAVR